MNKIRAISLVLVLLTLGFDLMAQTYPVKTITLITPFPAGGSTDSISRLIAINLTKTLGQTVVVDNRAGAGGNIGCDIVAKAPADGYTLLLTSSSTHSIGAAFAKKVPFNYDTDFTPIIHVATAPQVFLVTKKIPVSNLKEFIEYAKTHPNELNFSSAGVGTIMHLTGEYFNASTGTTMIHIPYKGSGLSMPDLISGKIQVVFDSVISGLQHIQDGKLTAIAVTSRKRISSIPNVPTMMEIGAPYGLGNFLSEALWAMYGPKNLPPSIVKRINTDVNQILLLPEVKQEFANMGATTGRGTPQEMNQMMNDDRKRWERVIAERHIVAD